MRKVIRSYVTTSCHKSLR